MKTYDIYHLGISGGKDSTAALLWIIFESKIPKEKLIISFCDTGNEDPLTYAFIHLLERFHPIHKLFPQKFFYELAKSKGRFPSRKARFCTHHLKIIPSREFLLELMRTQGDVLNITGIRQAEGAASNERGNLEKLYFDDSLGCDVFHPLYEFSLDEIWQLHKKYLKIEWILEIIQTDPNMDPNHKKYLIRRIQKKGIPRNPLYDMGASRVGCFPCINSRKLEIRFMNRYRPEKVEFLDLQENDFENENNFSSFFSKKMTPIEFRSKTVITSKGEEEQIPTIHDVIKWAKTKKNQPWQFELDFDNPPDSACDLRGFCE